MVDATKELRHLKEVKRLIVRGTVLVAEQERRVAQLRGRGHPTQNAKQTLETFKNALESLLTIHGVILETLRDIDAGRLQATPPAA